MNEYIYVGEGFYSKENAKVSVLDKGYLFGDGVFEGIRFYNSKIFRFDEHMKRLYDSAKVIMLNIPLGYDEFKELIKESVRRSGFVDGYLRVIVSRGEGDLGFDIRKCLNPCIVIIPAQLKLYPQESYDNGISLITVPTRRNLNESLSPRIKSLNYLNNIMAKIEATNHGFEEAIMLTNDGFVAECTADNIFHIKNGIIYTPATYHGALEGITRSLILEIAEKNKIKLVETTIVRYDLYTADEVFITGTAAEILPVINIDSRVIGSGKPGSMVSKLIEDFRKITRNEGEPV